MAAALASLTRSLLAVSWAVPPRVYPRSIQVAHSLKELARRGWLIDVVALDATADPLATLDPEFGADFKDWVQIFSIDLSDIQEMMKHRLIWRYNRLRKYFDPAFDLMIDGWMRRGRRRAQRLIRRQRPRALITFAQPWSDHLIGWRLKHANRRLPWIAHFSDPWVDSPYNAAIDPVLRSKWPDQERRVIESADAVVFVSEACADLVMRKYPASWREKVHIVPHAFDPLLRRLIAPAPRSLSHRQVMHAGSLFAGLRDPAKFLKAIAAMKTTFPADELPRVDFVGSDYSRLAAELGVDDIVKFHARRGYFETLRMLAAADVLLVIDTDEPGNVFLPSKIFDYLMTGKLIFALTQATSPMASILRPRGHVCIDSDDPVVIAAALRETLKSVVVRPAPSDLELVADEFSVSQATDRLESAIEAAAARAGR